VTLFDTAMEESARPSVVPAVCPPGWRHQSGPSASTVGKTGSVSSAAVGRPMFKCAECETRFTSLTMLEAHMMTHIGNTLNTKHYYNYC